MVGKNIVLTNKCSGHVLDFDHLDFENDRLRYTMAENRF